MQESVDDAIIAQDGGNDVQLTLEAWKPEGEAFFRFSNEWLEKYSTWFYFTHGFWRYDGRPIFDFPRRAVLLDMVVEEETWLRPMDQMHEYAGAEDSEKKNRGDTEACSAIWAERWGGLKNCQNQAKEPTLISGGSATNMHNIFR